MISDINKHDDNQGDDHDESSSKKKLNYQCLSATLVTKIEIDDRLWESSLIPRKTVEGGKKDCVSLIVLPT